MKRAPVKKVSPVKIVDARKSLVLEVTEDDIKNSVRRDSKLCVLAVTVKRQLKADAVRIHISRAYVRHGDTWTRYLLNDRARQELIVFDRGGKFESGEFILQKPRPGSKLGATGGSHKSTGTGRKIKYPVHISGTKNVRHTMATGPGLYEELEA